MSFSKKDIEQIENKGLTIEQVNAQIDLLKEGLPFINLKSAATIENGILKLSETEEKLYIDFFKDIKNKKSFIKFVPASGAATRMFKFLFDFLREFEPEKESINAYVNRQKATDLSIFFVGIKKFPFYYKVKQLLYKDHKDFDDFSINHQLLLFIKTMLQ